MKKAHFLLTAVAGVATIFGAGIAAAQDSLYVADTASPNSLTVIAPNGTTTTITNSTYIDNPTGLAFNNSGDLFIANSGTGEITEYNTSNDTFSNFVATGLVNPQGLAFDSEGNLYVANEEPGSSGGGITQYQITGGVITNTNSLYAGSQNNPIGITVDAGGNLYVTLAANEIARVGAGGGAASTTDFSVPGLPLNGPSGIVFGPNGDLYVVNSNIPSVEQIPLSLGGPFLLTSVSDNSLQFPEGLIFDADGNLYVADEGSNQVTEYSLVPGSKGDYQLVDTFNSGSGPTFLAIGPGGAVPEPSTYVLLLSGLGVLFLYQRRRTAVPAKI